MIKNITLSAEESLLRRARAQASLENTTLNAAFRQWLSRYAGVECSASAYQDLMDRLTYADPGESKASESPPG